MINKTIAHYKILEKLGEGGMGVVYKAEDTKLNRTVALKFLPTNQLATEEDKRRFKQEAKAAAQLSHANIATVYEINEHDGQTFIAMEYIEGETIAEKIKNRPLKIKEAMKIAKQVAEGLHCAHELGIIHRDIKSANIMITSKGVAKITDFGLAKMSTASRLTKAGMAIGTISYMSPEQAQGEKIDHRSDIWSLGVVLYEMIAGKLPFDGHYEAAIVYSIMNEPPEPLTAVRTGVPMDLEKIVNKLLAKDPDERYQNIIELPVDIKNVSMQDAARSKTGPYVGTNTLHREKNLKVEARYSYKTIFKMGALVIPAIILTYLLKPDAPAPEPERSNKMVIPLPENTSLLFSSYNTMAISPDGKDIVYVGVAGNRGVALFLKRAGSFASIELENPSDARSPFFSPDGRWLGYVRHQSDEINKVLLDGGSPSNVAKGKGATWGADNTIIFADERILKRVPDSGGEPIILTKARNQTEEHLFPHMLPDGKTVLFTIAQQAGELSTYRLAVYSFGDENYRVILDEEGYNAVYARSGYIVYGRSGKLMGVAFDLETLKVKGIPFPVLDNVYTLGTGSMSYALSNEGTIIYAPDTRADALISVLTIDFSGKTSNFVNLKKEFAFVRYSPDAKLAAFEIRDSEKKVSNYNIWIYHVDGGALNQLTFHEGFGTNTLAWSPDSKTIAYVYDKSIILRNIHEAERAVKIYTVSDSIDAIAVTDWSQNGDKLAFAQRNDKRNRHDWDIFVYSFEDSSAKPFLSSPASEFNPQFSPSGKWILYTSNESGIREVYVRSYPESTNRIWKISNGGGLKPLWSRDGKKIYYWSENELLSAGVTSGDVFSKSNPQMVFSGDYSATEAFDIHPDGDKFIVIQRQELEQRQIFIIQNFIEELKNRVLVSEN